MTWYFGPIGRSKIQTEKKCWCYLVIGQKFKFKSMAKYSMDYFKL